MGPPLFGLGAARGDRQGDERAQRHAYAVVQQRWPHHTGSENRDLKHRLSRAQAEAMRAPSASAAGSFAAPIDTDSRPAVSQTTIKEKNMRSGVVKGRVIGGGKKRGKLAFDSDPSDDDVVPLPGKKAKKEED